MKIFLKFSHNQQRKEIEYDESDSVYLIKENLLKEDENIVSIKQYRFIFSGRVLKNNSLLSDYKIKDGNTILVMIRKKVPTFSPPPPPPPQPSTSLPSLPPLNQINIPFLPPPPQTPPQLPQTPPPAQTPPTPPQTPPSPPANQNIILTELLTDPTLSLADENAQNNLQVEYLDNTYNFTLSDYISSNENPDIDIFDFLSGSNVGNIINNVNNTLNTLTQSHTSSTQPIVAPAATPVAQAASTALPTPPPQQAPQQSGTEHNPILIDDSTSEDESDSFNIIYETEDNDELHQPQQPAPEPVPEPVPTTQSQLPQPPQTLPPQTLPHQVHNPMLEVLASIQNMAQQISNLQNNSTAENNLETILKNFCYKLYINLFLSCLKFWIFFVYYINSASSSD